MRNAYAELCLKVQALRREFEGLRTPLASATGVAASIYTHQVANVHRVLTDVRVRHLLADEVGLGKTVQALMVLNSLRHQRPDLRALVIAPDRLVPQWRDEILTRAHSVPRGADVDGEGSQYIRLAWEAQLGMKTNDGKPKWTLADIDPDRYQVLVVDEVHRLTSRLQERIVRVAGRFEHLLLLTATPTFQDVQKRSQLFAMLEPERSQLVRASVGAGRDVVEELMERDRVAAMSCLPHDLTREALTNCVYRRVIRTRRADYRGVLPNRKHISILTEPLAAEEERQALMWEYFSHLGDISLEVDPVLLAKRVILSPPSLEQRVDFLRRKGHERQGLLERAKPLVHRRNGDSRADALVDLLAEIWTNDPSERVLVAAQDNLTVDYLFEIVNARLPLIGPLGDRVPLAAARTRQGMMTEAIEDLGGYGNETNENLEAFQRGDAQVLFAPEADQVGLNLQCARILVLYSVPWKPEEVEQWIGRLDRIGNATVFATLDEAKAIEIYTIAQEGLVDENVVTVLRHFHTFERPVNLDGEHLDDVARLIEAAALRPEQANWRGIGETTEALAAEDQVTELESPLRPFLPWGVEWASALRKQLEELPPAPFSVSQSGGVVGGPRSWDRAVEGMLRILGRADEYSFRWNDDTDGSRFLSLWYRYGEMGPDGKKSIRSKVVFSVGADPSAERSPIHSHACITRRGDITAPPRRHVTLTLQDGDSAKRPLNFMNFGNALHDELTEGWLPDKAEALSINVALPEFHPVFEFAAESLYVVRLAVLDPASRLQDPALTQCAVRAIAAAATRVDRDHLNDLMPPFSKAVQCAIEADVRWLRTQLTAQFVVQGLKAQDKRWVAASHDELSALLNPLVCPASGVPSSTVWKQSQQVARAVELALDRLRSTDQGEAGTRWSPRFPNLETALQLRLAIVREEARDAINLAGVESARADSALALARENGTQGQITKASNALAEALDKADMTQVLWQHREAWLADCRSRIQKVVPEERLTMALSVSRMS